MIPLLENGIDKLNSMLGGFYIYDDSVGFTHQNQLLKITFIDLLGRLQNTKDLIKMTDLFKTISGLYFVDPSSYPNLNT
jgi:hypothetical protein